MNNNLVKFIQGNKMDIYQIYIKPIEDKMNKLYEKQMKLCKEISILDTKLNNIQFVSILDINEYISSLKLINKKEIELTRVKNEYRNLNATRLHALGLI